MQFTRQRKIFLGIGALALTAFGADRIFFGSSVSGPESASADSVTDSQKAAAATTAEIDALLNDEDPTATVSLSQQLTQLARRRPALLNDDRDAFRPSTDWIGLDGTAQGMPTDAAGFREAHELVALMPKHRRPCAMVDGQTLFVGQMLDGFTLVAVRDRSAIFESAGRRVELQMGSDQAPH